MDDIDENITAAERLLYDDEAPRIRRPINASVLMFRKPALFFLPLAVLISAGLPAAAGGFVMAGALPWTPPVVAAGLGSFLAIILFVSLVMASRGEKSFALLVPNTLSTAHAFLVICFVAAFVMAGPMGRTEIPQILSMLPGPPVEGLHLQFAKAYILFFLAVTVCSVASIMLMRVLGFRRVIAGSA